MKKTYLLTLGCFIFLNAFSQQQVTPSYLFFNENMALTPARNWAIKQNSTSDGKLQIGCTDTYMGLLPDFSVNPDQAKLTILSDGRVGIGTVTPYQALSVKGHLSISPKGMVPSEGCDGSLMITRDPTSGQFINLTRKGYTPWSIGNVFNTSTFAIGIGKTDDNTFTSPFFNIDMNGNVGIGTTTPVFKVDVTGEIRSTLNGVSNLRMTGGSYSSMLRNDGANTFLLLTNNNDINGSWNTLRPWYVNNSTGNMLFADGKFQITHSTGNVGIGTTTPLAKLHIESGSNCNYSAILATSMNGSFNNRLVVSSTNLFDVNTETFRISHEFNDLSTRNNGFIGFSRGGSVAGGFLTFGSNGTERMRIDGDGNVGIGTTSPAATLDVNGKVFLRTVESIAGWSRSYLNWSAHSLVMGSPVGTYAHNSVDFEPGGCSQAPIFSQLRMFTAVNETDHQLKIQFTTTGDCFFNNDGNVGIGSTAPDQKLTVKGKIHAEEVIVDLAVPADYVFKPTYKLMPLTQVEQYVKTNSHLPEVPSAGEITKNGMNMGEMQNKLLQKIEELTLYVIEQQKQIQSLHSELETLKSK